MSSKAAVTFMVKDSIISGMGLYATGFIWVGETVVVWRPKVLSKQEAAKLPPEEYEHYTYPDGIQCYGRNLPRDS